MIWTCQARFGDVRRVLSKSRDICAKQAHATMEMFKMQNEMAKAQSGRERGVVVNSRFSVSS